MSLVCDLNFIYKNKVILYLVSRYLTYFIQFVTSVLIAVKLGPYYMGIWGFVLLVLNYFQIINFGISNATNILLVQNKKRKHVEKEIVRNSVFLIAILGMLILFCGIINSFCNVFSNSSYDIGNYFWIVCLIALLVQFNQLFINIFRVKNCLAEVAVYQSLVPFLSFVVVFFFSQENLLYALIMVYLLGYVFSFLTFVRSRKVKIEFGFKKKISYVVLKKGLYLFVYNFLFYLILVTTRTIISVYYTVEEFGLFTFSYTMGHAMLLLLEAFVFVVFPKVVDKLNTEHAPVVIKEMILSIQRLYTTVSHLVVYFSIAIFPLLISLMPKYSSALVTLNLISLSLLIYTHAFSYNVYLMARNEEKKIAFISVASLVSNVVLSIVLVRICKVTYEYVIISTMISYFLFTILNAIYSFKRMKIDISIYRLLLEVFDLKLMIPFIIAIAVTLLNIKLLFMLPFVICILVNRESVKSIIVFAKNVIFKPSIVDLK